VYVITPDGIAVTQRVHAAVLICVKTAAILGAILSLGPLKEEDYMRLVRQALEPKDRLVGLAGCQHVWPCYGKPAIIFHDRGKIFTSERARQVLVDRLGIITEQAPPYAPSAKGIREVLMGMRLQRNHPKQSNAPFLGWCQLTSSSFWIVAFHRLSVLTVPAPVPSLHTRESSDFHPTNGAKHGQPQRNRDGQSVK